MAFPQPGNSAVIGHLNADHCGDATQVNLWKNYLYLISMRFGTEIPTGGVWEQKGTQDLAVYRKRGLFRSVKEGEAASPGFFCRKAPRHQAFHARRGCPIDGFAVGLHPFTYFTQGLDTFCRNQTFRRWPPVQEVLELPRAIVVAGLNPKPKPCRVGAGTWATAVGGLE